MNNKAETAASRLQDLADGPASEAAETIEAAFERAGQGIERALAAAARAGELDFSRMTQSILADLARLAVERFVVEPALGALTPLSGTITGARAEGGPMAPGQAYLVGERGPEVITPATMAQAQPAEPGLTVNLTMPAIAAGDPPSATRLARQIARAVQKGSRYL